MKWLPPDLTPMLIYPCCYCSTVGPVSESRLCKIKVGPASKSNEVILPLVFKYLQKTWYYRTFLIQVEDYRLHLTVGIEISFNPVIVLLIKAIFQITWLKVKENSRYEDKIKIMKTMNIMDVI